MVAYIAGDFDQVEVTSTISNLPALVNRQLSFIFPTQPLQKIMYATIVRHLGIAGFHPVDLGALHFFGSVPGTSDTYTGLTNYTPAHLTRVLKFTLNLKYTPVDSVDLFR